MNILENIHGHNDLIALNEEERELLCRQIREFLVSKVSRTGGHLASNLGVVELTLAIETVFDILTARHEYSLSTEHFRNFCKNRRTTLSYDPVGETA